MDNRWIFTRYRVRKLTGLDPEAHRNSRYGTWSVPEIFFCPLTLVQGSRRKVGDRKQEGRSVV